MKNFKKSHNFILYNRFNLSADHLLLKVINRKHFIKPFQNFKLSMKETLYL